MLSKCFSIAGLKRPAALFPDFYYALAAVLLLFLASVSSASGQGCSQGLTLQPGHMLEYRTYKKNSKKLLHLARHRVKELEQLEDRVLAHLKCAFYTPDGTVIRSFNYFIGCKGDLLILDKEVLSDPHNLVLFEDKTFVFDGQNIHYPANAQPGDTLRRALHAVEVNTGRIKMASVNTALLDRRVEGIQEITTPAGKFTAYKISYRHELLRGSEEMSITQRRYMVEYVVPGLGPVRSEEYSKRGKLLRYTELASLKLDPNPAE